MYIVVTGPPGSGKSTLARSLADELGLPLLAKDTVKQALVESLGAPGVEESRLLGRAAVQVLLAVAREAGGGVLDSVWVDKEAARAKLARLGDVAEVFCRCDVETMHRRYAARAATRPAGWFDLDRDEPELWPAVALEPLAGGWPVVEVDTSRPVDVTGLVPALSRPPGPTPLRVSRAFRS